MKRVAGRWCRVVKGTEKPKRSAAERGQRRAVRAQELHAAAVSLATRTLNPRELMCGTKRGTLRQNRPNPAPFVPRSFVYEIAHGETATVRGIAYQRSVKGVLRRAQ